MATTALQKSRLRRDVGADSSSLPDADIDALFVEAEELYSDAATIAAYARVLALQGIMASAAKLTDYRANNSSENLSDVFDHLSKLLTYWETKVDEADEQLNAYLEIY